MFFDPMWEEMQAELNAEADYINELKAEHWDYYPDGEYVPNPYTADGGPVVRPMDEDELEDGDYVAPLPNEDGEWDD